MKFIAYTSLLHADKSPLGLADEHIETEKMLADSGIVYTLLAQRLVQRKLPRQRTGSTGARRIYRCRGDGKIASATRQIMRQLRHA
ncbi:NAD(P)H:quinone oxidoreductase [Escherichia coli]|uniref:NAD(P)H:quinone oxidoreductase n=1 Tax=Escherichia coli TaxID=562 RepID=A0A2X3KIR5_ECOLX|nr:NAD(P)H:quinone oxidoreductase [Escherichia coli]